MHQVDTKSIEWKNVLFLIHFFVQKSDIEEKQSLQKNVEEEMGILDKQTSPKKDLQNDKLLEQDFKSE